MSKVIDETGKTYGYLTVLGRAKSTKGGSAKWHCQCKCGNFVDVIGGSLRSGKTKSCGCYQRQRTSEACLNNLIGKTIGNFTVLGYEPGHNGARGLWICKCNLCGNEQAKINGSNLFQQESCGCLIESKGTRKIREILEKFNIEFIVEKRFETCKFSNGYYARFDFYLPLFNCLIEYDGRQHYLQGQGNYDNEEKFLLTQEHDEFKNEWAKNNGFHLIRIPYTHFDNLSIEDILPTTSKFLLR